MAASIQKKSTALVVSVPKPPQGKKSQEQDGIKEKIRLTNCFIKGKVASVRGCTSSVPIFANGAQTAAFTHLFNAELSAWRADGDSNQSQQPTGNQISGKNEFKQCVATCIMDNYGALYETAGALNPLSLSGIVGNEVAEALDTELQKQGNRNSYGNSKQFQTGQRQLRTLSQFRKFNAASLILGAGAIGFQLGAQGYCRVECTNF